MTFAVHTFQLEGQYSGWARSPTGEWEDLIGMIKVECQPTEGPSGPFIITVKSIEFGSWQGTIAKDEKMFRAETGQDNSFFLCSVRTEEQFPKVRTVLDGAIWSVTSDKLMDIRFFGDWRSSKSGFSVSTKEYNQELDAELARDGSVDETLLLKLLEAYQYDAATTVNWVSGKLRILRRRLEAGEVLSVFEIKRKEQVDVTSGADFTVWVRTNFPTIDL